MKNVFILGSTGTIGVNTLKVISTLSKFFNVYGITCHKNISRLKSQVDTYRPKYAVITDEKKYSEFIKKHGTKIKNTKIYYGVESINNIIEDNKLDTIIAAIVGFACLNPVLTAIKNNKKILVANKEILVSAGDLIVSYLKKSKSLLLPLDSEHNSLLQIIVSSGLEYRINDKNYYEKKIQSITLTASGGPFLDYPIKKLNSIKAKDAVKHPTWKMGKKISVDSSTMMNKGLELIEAKTLFNLDIKNINAVIHRASLVHAFIEFIDGSIIFHMSDHDMKIPIAYALCYPDRIRNKKRIIDKIDNIIFEPLNINKFRCFELARIAAKNGKNSGLILNSANEISVEYFLKDKIKYMDIPRIIEIVMDKNQLIKHKSVKELIENDQEIRAYTKSIIHKRFL